MNPIILTEWDWIHSPSRFHFPLHGWKGLKSWIPSDNAYSLGLFEPYASLLPLETLEPLWNETWLLGEGVFLIGVIYLSISSWDTELEKSIRAYEFVEIRFVVTSRSRELWLKSNSQTNLFYSLSEFIPRKRKGAFTFQQLVQRVYEMIEKEIFEVYERNFNP